jgi:lysophospholipase L1-like esterase
MGAVAAVVLGLVAAFAFRGTASLAAPPVSAHFAVARQVQVRPPDLSFPSCEQQLEHAPPSDPRLAVLGASFTAGVGSSPGHSWAVQLARHLHWGTVVYGVPGAGYVRPGAGHGGPVRTEAARAGLPKLNPSLVIVQVGHDDIGVPPAAERQRVTQAINFIQSQAPHARLVLLTVFPGRSASAAAARTDQAITTAARAADPGVIIIDPLTGHWTFPHIKDGLHPTAAGSSWIASQVAAVLHADGIHPAHASQAPPICIHA